jgi:hypothetical protein
MPWATIARFAAGTALLPAITALTALTALTGIVACDRGSPKHSEQRQAQADPTAMPEAPQAAVPQAPPAAAPPGPSTAVPPAAAPPAVPPVPRLPLPVAPAARPPAAAEPASADSLPPPHYVAAPAEDELRRKRAEWEELQRMQEQARSNVEAWQRSRRSTDGAPAVPRVGDAQRTENQVETGRMQDAMRAWYRRYSGRSAAVTLALSQYGMAASALPLNPSLLRDACGKLLAASTALLDDPQALPAPLGNASAALSTAYAEIRATAKACLLYRDEDRAAHLAAALRAMAAAGTALRPYGMTP